MDYSTWLFHYLDTEGREVLQQSHHTDGSNKITGKAMAKALSLIGISGSRIGQSTVFAERSTIVGSDGTCGVVLSDRLILPRHAEVRVSLGHWFIISLDPRATIFVNGQPVTGQQRIAQGDLVTLGSATFKVMIGEAERAVGQQAPVVQPESHGREDWWRD